MSRTITRAFILIACCHLVACGSVDISPRRYSDVYLKNELRAPASPPRIIAGQVANVIYTEGRNHNFSGVMSRNIAESWRKTGLFAQVNVTNTRTPSAQGFTIQTHCEGTVYTHRDGGVGDMAFLLTAGAIPHTKGRDEWECSSEIFQNGTVISTSRSEWDFLWFDGGWGGSLTLSQEQILDTGYKAVGQHIVTRDLVALKKAYP